MSDNPEGAQREMEKAIFISADCWLCVFDLLPRFQLGLGIALISRRFDYFVDEHFKTRKWTFDYLQIQGKIGENGAKKIEIVNSNFESLPIPQNPLPNKVIGFGRISIYFFDQNVLNFIGHLHHLFASCSTELIIISENVRVSEFIMLNIWPMLKDTIHEMYLNPIVLRQMRQLVPSMLNDCPFLYKVSSHYNILPEFPPDDSANASDGQAVTKWLFTPRPDNFPKHLNVKIANSEVDQWLATVEQIKAAFSTASSPVHFCIFIQFPSFSSLSSVVPFKLTNQLTAEKLALFKYYAYIFLLIRCPNATCCEVNWKKEIKLFYEKNWRKEIKGSYGRKHKKIVLFIKDMNCLLDDLSAGSSGDH